MPQNQYFGRQVQDANFISVTALPAANANVNSGSFDLGQRSAVTNGLDAGFNVENCELQVTVPATPNLADTKSITFTFQDSADNSTFAAAPTGGVIGTVTGAGGAGAAATTFKFRIPNNVRRYVNVNAAVAASGGTNTAVSFTVKLLF